MKRVLQACLPSKRSVRARQARLSTSDHVLSPYLVVRAWPQVHPQRPEGGGGRGENEYGDGDGCDRFSGHEDLRECLFYSLAKLTGLTNEEPGLWSWPH